MLWCLEGEVQQFCDECKEEQNLKCAHVFDEEYEKKRRDVEITTECYFCPAVHKSEERVFDFAPAFNSG